MTREQAIEHGKSQLEVFGGKHGDFIKLAIKALEQEPRKGHWINTCEYVYRAIDCIECSCCHYKSLEEGNYCPNCGAKMEGGRQWE